MFAANLTTSRSACPTLDVAGRTEDEGADKEPFLAGCRRRSLTTNIVARRDCPSQRGPGLYDVRCGSKADLSWTVANVRFVPKADVPSDHETWHLADAGDQGGITLSILASVAAASSLPVARARPS